MASSGAGAVFTIADGHGQRLFDLSVSLRAGQVLRQADGRLHWVISITGIRSPIVARALIVHGEPNHILSAALGIEQAPKSRVGEFTGSKVESSDHTVFATSHLDSLCVPTS
jgi:hypothetical protein